MTRATGKRYRVGLSHTTAVVGIRCLFDMSIQFIHDADLRRADSGITCMPMTIVNTSWAQIVSVSSCDFDLRNVHHVDKDTF